jgi:F-box domain
VDRSEAKLPGISSVAIEGVEGAEDVGSDDASTNAAEQFSALAAQREPGTQPQLGIGRLPPDIVQHIMSRLHPHDANALSRTNSHFRTYRTLTKGNRRLHATHKRAEAANIKMDRLQKQGHLDPENESFAASYAEIGPDFAYIDEPRANDLIKAVEDKSTAMTEENRSIAISSATAHWKQLTERQQDAFFDAAMTIKNPQQRVSPLVSIGLSLRHLTPTQQARWVGAVVELPQEERLDAIIFARVGVTDLSSDGKDVLRESISELPDSEAKNDALAILRPDRSAVAAE